MSFSGDINSIIYYLAKQEGHENYVKSLIKQQNFKDYLLKIDMFRVYIEDSNNFGHHTNTINIVRNLIRLGFKGQIQLICADSTVLTKLATLLPLLIDENTEPITAKEQIIQLDSITVDVMALTEDSTTVKIREKTTDFCITGGFDNNDDQRLIKPTSKLNVKYFIALQPYLFSNINTSSVCRIYKQGKANESVDLETEPELGEGFSERGYYFPFPEREPKLWNFYKQQKRFIKSIEVIEKLVEHSENFNICPIYGIAKNFSFKENKSHIILTNLILGISEAQQKGFTGNKNKAVLVLFDSEINFKEIEQIFHIDSHYKYQTRQLEDYLIFKNLKINILKNPLDNKITFIKKADINKLEDILLKLKDGSILILHLGNVPNPVFNYVYSKATLPFVFEGEGTIPLAFSLGKPFFYLKKVESEKLFYPSFFLGDQHGTITHTCSQITNLLYKELSFIESLDMPDIRANKIANFIIDSYRQESELQKYFTAIQQFYTKEIEDKAFRTLLYLHSNFLNK